MTHATRCRAAFPVEKRGSLPAPPDAQRAEGGFRRQATGTQRGQRVSATAATERHEQKYADKGGLRVGRPIPTPSATPAGLPESYAAASSDSSQTRTPRGGRGTP